MKGKSVRPIIIMLLGWMLSAPLFAAAFPDEAQIRQELQQAQTHKSAANQADIVESLQSALNLIAEGKASAEHARQYQTVIDDFPKLTAALRQQLAGQEDNPLRSTPNYPPVPWSSTSCKPAATCWN